jgi:hypothetical protein
VRPFASAVDERAQMERGANWFPTRLAVRADLGPHLNAPAPREWERNSFFMNQILFREWGRSGLKIGFGQKIAILCFAGDMRGRMGRGAGFRGCAQYQKLREGSAVFAIIAGFEAMLAGEGAGAGQAAKGDGGEGCPGRAGEVIAAGSGYLAPKGGGLNPPYIHQRAAGAGLKFFRGEGPGGFSGGGAIRCDLTFGCHADPSVNSGGSAGLS